MLLLPSQLPPLLSPSNLFVCPSPIPTVCYECPAGTIGSIVSGLALCGPCTLPNSIPISPWACGQCQSGFTTSDDSLECVCPESTYYTIDSTTHEGTCASCPSGAYCPKASTVETLTVLEQHWRSELDVSELRSCPLGSNEKPSCINSGTSLAGDSLCAPGHTGVMCSVCDKDYYLDSQLNM